MFDLTETMQDNHVTSAGGIVPAINRVKAYLASHSLQIPVEVETRTISELEQGTNQILTERIKSKP